MIVVIPCYGIRNRSCAKKAPLPVIRYRERRLPYLSLMMARLAPPYLRRLCSAVQTGRSPGYRLHHSQQPSRNISSGLLLELNHYSGGSASDSIPNFPFKPNTCIAYVGTCSQVFSWVNPLHHKTASKGVLLFKRCIPIDFIDKKDFEQRWCHQSSDYDHHNYRSEVLW